jgi:hypothetical protein
MRVAVSAICLLVLAGGCASSGSSTPRFTPPPDHHDFLTAEQFAAMRDSARAQDIANQVGPGAFIRAEYANVSGMRRVVASFHVDADAYVLIGHIDADGVLRVVFPSNPGDDGFVRGNRDYRTPEFFAGFTDQYRYRYQQQGLSYASRPVDSYDARMGYAFIIASWRPMRFDQFQTEGRWDSFELSDESYLDDPRPAIYELASLLAGQNREAYTVSFAKYSTTMPLYAGAYGYGSDAFYGGRNVAYCAGYSPFGYGSVSMFMPISYFGYGQTSAFGTPFYSRGQYYLYDEIGDCVRTGYPPGVYPGYYGSGYGYRVAGTGAPAQPVPMRGLVPRDRAPVGPQSLGNHTLPVSRVGATDAAGALPASPTYQQRGLITPDDPATMPARRTPSVDTRSQVETHTRPSIQEMVSRRPQTPDANSQGWSRAQSLGRTTNDASNAGPARPAYRRGEPGTTTETRATQPVRAEPRSYQPPQAETRAQPPQTETRTVAPVREAPSRPSPPAEMRAPSPPPSPPPASSSSSGSSSSGSSSTGGRPPGPPTS